MRPERKGGLKGHAYGLGKKKEAALTGWGDRSEKKKNGKKKIKKGGGGGL